MGSCEWISLVILLLPLVFERKFLHNLQTVNNIKNEKAPQYVYVCNVFCIVIYPTKNYVTRSNGILICDIYFPKVNISDLYLIFSCASIYQHLKHNRMYFHMTNHIPIIILLKCYGVCQFSALGLSLLNFIQPVYCNSIYPTVVF